MRRVLGCLAVSVLLAACGNRPPGAIECGGSYCKDGEVCDEATKLCVADLAPTLVIDAPVENALIGSATFELRGSVSDDNGAPEGLEYQVGEGAWVPLQAGEGGTFGAQVETPVLDGVATPVRVHVKDARGQVTELMRQVRFDRVAPECAFAASLDAGINTLSVTDAGVFTVSADVTDGSGKVASSEFSFDDGASWLSAAREAGNAHVEWTVPSDDGVDHSIRFRAQDEAGNSCAISTVTRVDVVPPAVVISAPNAGTTITSAPFMVRATVTDGSGVARVYEGTWDDAANALDPAWTDLQHTSGDDYEGQFPPLPTDFAARQLGVSAIDLAGNIGVTWVPIHVDTKGPGIVITSPDAGDLLNASAIADGGVSLTFAVTEASPLPVAVTVLARRMLADGGSVDGGAIVFDGGAVQGTANFLVGVPTQSVDDGVDYVAEVQVKDAYAQAGTAARGYSVDVVAPNIVSLNPPSGTRLISSVTATFNEPVTVFNPTNFMQWDAGTLAGDQAQPTPTTLSVTNLSPATVYAGEVHPIGVDRAGNAIKQWPSVRYYSAPIAAPNSATYDVNVSYFTVTSDPDGVVSYAMVKSTGGGNYAVIVRRINPKTGAADYDAINPPPIYIYPGSGSPNPPFPTTFDHWLSGWAVVNPDLSSESLVTYTQYFQPNPGTASFQTWVGGSLTKPMEGPLTGALQGIPLPATTPDPARTSGPIDYGLLTGTSASDFVYQRPPKADVALGLMPYNFAIQDSAGWEIAEIQGTNLVRKFYRCYPPAPPLNQASCALSSARTIATNLTSTGIVPRIVSMAATSRGTTLYVYDNNSGTRTEACRVSFTPDGCRPGINCPVDADVTSPQSELLNVASEHVGGLVMGIRRRNGMWELVERDLTTCDSVWTVRASISENSLGPKIQGNRAYIYPVRFGTKLAAIYLSVTGSVTTWVP